MIKIAIVSPVLMVGGAESMAVRLASNIDRDKYNVLFICLGSNIKSSLDDILLKAGVNVIYLGKTDSKSIGTAIKLYRVLSKFKPDIVHSHIAGTLYSIPWIFTHNKVCIHTVHTRPDKEFSNLTYKVVRYLIRRNKMVICAVSKENREIALNYYNCDIDKVCFVNNPVCVSNYHHDTLNDGMIRIVNVSRQDLNKNQILALRALKDLLIDIPNLILILVGDGNQHQTLCEFVEKNELKDHVIMPGLIADVDRFLSISDIYVSCSHIEGLPLSILEAMASRLPIVSSDVGGIRDLIDGNGFLFEDDDLENLKNHIARLCNDEKLRIEYGNKSYEIVKQFDVKECAKNYQIIYEENIR